MEQNSTSRNGTLDLLKLISAYMIVFIHVPFYSMSGTIISALARFAVPIFFMTAGYFCYQNDTRKIKKKLLKIVYILIFASLLYNVMNIGIAYISSGVPGIIDTISVFAKPERWIELLLFNLPFSANRLWFLFALIYVYGIQLIVNKCKIGYRWIFCFSLLGLALNLVLGELLSAFGVELPLHYVRNFLLTGYPFFGFGLLLRHNHEKIHLCNATIISAILIGGIALTLASVCYAPNVTLCLGAVLVAFATFLISLKGAHIQYRNWQIHVFECNLGIYILHRPIAVLCAKALNMFNLFTNPVLYNTLLPLIVCVVTTAVVLILNALTSFRTMTNS